LVDCIFNRTNSLPWGLGCIIYTVSTGIGTWGLNKTVGWAWDINNFLVGWYWSRWNFDFAVYYFPSTWRMQFRLKQWYSQLFKLDCFQLHMGRPWLAYWVFPIPNQFGSLGELNSPLLGCICNSTYLLFHWFSGGLVAWFCN
jgi:molybdopterin-containing oxidoreductase family membrane subunit